MNLTNADHEADAEKNGMSFSLAKLKIVRGTDPIKQVRGQRGTDFVPFFKKGIPCVAFSSNGPHLAYHRSGDTIYRINPDILADIARVGFLTAVNMANWPGAIGP